MRNRRSPVLVACVLAVLFLSGCVGAENPSPQAAIETPTPDLQTLLSSLQAIVTVDDSSVAKPQVNGASDSDIGIEVTVFRWDEAALGEIVDAVAAAAKSEPELGIRSIAISQSTGQSLGDFHLSFPTRVSSAALQSEIHYWLALSAVFPGQLSMSLGGDVVLADGDYARQISSGGLYQGVDWAAVRAVPDTSAAWTAWYFGSVIGWGALPPDDVFELHQAISSYAGASPADSVTTRYSAKSGSIGVGIGVTEWDSTDLTLSQHWPMVLDAVQRILQTGYASADFQYNGGPGGAVHFGPCGVGGTYAEHESANDALWAALTSTALVFPADSGAGQCRDA